ncbi:histidine kinase dimerization/phosphoacceptor domain -containing protein [Bosea sp. (in: a-proteobacteria)]|uniref:histidine kinase dimerization/phosphoacceptor domain -containing protein n=1 Tax=Bosea sp. (in: a-proteobacteria) TaxID=1871050 RepID=UPI002B4809F6|nr:PAS domain-containing protein [Bosea sp. (in: a-proteobacteria)]WRH60101.1 MAG: PAS domain-containing protein [Bosea sp. (in: a-proteobacteria)]
MLEKDDWHLTDFAHEQGRGDPFAAAVRATRMAMVITDPLQPDNPIVFCNQAFQNLTGYSREETLGRNCRFLQGPDTDPDAVAKVRQAIAEKTDVNVDLLNYRKDGTTFWNALYLNAVRNDAGDVQFYFASQLDVTARVEAQNAIAEQKAIVDAEVKRRTAELEAALEAKTLLLHEVDHRVKNNLTMIGALLRLQARQIDNPEMSAKLGVMMERIDALASVHRRLYQSKDVTQFDIAAFAKSMAADVIGASGRTDIKLVADIEAIDVKSDHASSVGLILNEMLTNVIKHGLSDGRAGTITLTARRTEDGSVVAISDNGHGIDLEKASDGLGRTLITRLSKQAGAKVTWERLEQGTRVTLQMAS